MERLLVERILPKFPLRRAGPIGLDELDDGAVVELPPGHVVVTTDSHVVKPYIFPGGDIGALAVCGTVNDLAVMGARPVALTLALVLEEGFPLSDLERILTSAAEVLAELGLPLVAGDTKVMGKGELDGIAINTTGIGVAERVVPDGGLRVGDAIVVTGPVGDHGMALLAAREGFHLAGELRSDVAPLWPLLAPVLATGAVRAAKDPTRGGLAAALNEMARKARVGIEVEEGEIPLRPAVRGVGELLGISPLEVACEGRAVLGVEPDRVDEVLTLLQSHPLGREARVLGRAVPQHPGRVVLATGVGGRRFLEMPLGDPVPRIC
ncbi:MAG: hydrogenase expression/formation protein HypE [Candidatus Bipolaricaulota bacterium]|nr:hydrogenase expression/formation protein HypE [Candidatus Bipolaricaulota bacterium]